MEDSSIINGTLDDLIAKLHKLREEHEGDLGVDIEGCDCEASWNGIVRITTCMDTKIVFMERVD